MTSVAQIKRDIEIIKKGLDWQAREDVVVDFESMTKEERDICTTAGSLYWRYEKLVGKESVVQHMSLEEKALVARAEKICTLYLITRKEWQKKQPKIH